MTLLESLLTATVEDIKDADNKIEALLQKRELLVSDIDVQIATLRQMKKLIELHVNGKEVPKIKSRAVDIDKGHPVNRIIEYINDEGPSYVTIIAKALDIPSAAIGQYLRHHPDKIVLTANKVHVVR